MARCDITERIHASPSRVWAFFQPDQIARWYSAGFAPVIPGPLGKGSRVKLDGVEAVVTEYAENRTLRLEGNDGGTAHEVLFLLVPKEGHTSILLRHDLNRPGALGRLMERFQTGGVAARGREALVRLKKLAENT